MPKRQRSDGQNGRPGAAKRRRRLHLVVDDWERGFTTYKIDTDDLDTNVVDMDSSIDSLPRQPVFRLGSQGTRCERFAAAGTTIFAVHAASNTTVAYDTETSEVTQGPSFLARKVFPVLFTVGDSIYALEGGGGDGEQRREPFLEVLGPAPPELGSRRPGQWAWRALPPPPVKPVDDPESYAVHPDGTALFLSVHRQGTFCFDTKSLAWTRLGGWLLPFDGQAFFVRRLNAWVGLSSHRMGYLAACDAFSGDGADCREPAWKVGRDQLYCRDRLRYMSSKLAYMGHAKFCLVEILTRKGHDSLDLCYDFQPRAVLYLTTFRVQYSGAGELQAVHRRSRSYELSEAATRRTPAVFCI